jgi:putative CocE/NonD family hydrolase
MRNTIARTLPYRRVSPRSYIQAGIEEQAVRRAIIFVSMCWFFLSPAAAQQIALPNGAAFGGAAAMQTLAKNTLAAYRESNRATYLDTLFRLQLVAGEYRDATQTLEQLRTLQAASPSLQLRVRNVQYALFAQAKTIEEDSHGTFAAAFAQAFHRIVEPMDDRTSALVVRSLNAQETGGLSLIVDMSALRKNLADTLAKEKGKISVSLSDALELLRAYQIEETYRSIEPLAAGLVAADDHRRYIVQSDVPVPTPDGAIVCTLIVRPRGGPARLPTLMEFSVYADLPVSMSEARRSASNGYVGVAGFSRGKLCSPGPVWPYEHDGADAAALIDWIARQPWSDGRVGMFGASYDGFTQWAAAKRRPKALKALMPQVSASPGIGEPMEGNIVQSFFYYWPFYTATNKTLNGAAFEDRAHWNRLFRDWYVSGKAYRDVDKIDGKPNPVWDRWMNHPSYDAYWQSLVPYANEFAQVDIPVLTTTGYYDGGQIGALYYLTQHYKYAPHAEHYLVVGPYDHAGGNRGTVNVFGDDVGVLDGYTLDRAAHIDFGELRYQWFDYVFKHGAKPAILKNRINYEVMSADQWKHAPSIAAMADGKQRLYFTNASSGFRLSATPSDKLSVQTMNFADRSDADRVAPGGDVLDKDLDTWGALEFISDPIRNATEVSGLFDGHLDFVANKKDFDFAVQLYELTPQGRYFELSWYQARASFVNDRSHRQLLEPGKRMTIDFTNGRLTSHRFQPGSRLIVLLSLFKQPSAQINYGTGRDVSDETIADAKEPLKIQWFGDSYLGLPVQGRWQ